MSDTGIPKVNVSLSAATDEEPEVDVSDEEFLQFDTSSVPVIVTLTKVICFFFALLILLCQEEFPEVCSHMAITIKNNMLIMILNCLEIL